MLKKCGVWTVDGSLGHWVIGSLGPVHESARQVRKPVVFDGCSYIFLFFLFVSELGLRENHGISARPEANEQGYIFWNSLFFYLLAYFFMP